jgi:hypothetical protein
VFLQTFPISHDGTGFVEHLIADLEVEIVHAVVFGQFEQANSDLRNRIELN